VPWYGYWPYYSTYGYYYDDGPQPGYTTVYGSSYGQPAYAPDPCPWTQTDAWELLAGGGPSAALDAFDCLADVLPDDGLPLIGYALAAALLDQHDDAIAVMRDALRVDPESLRYVPEDERLHGQVAGLLKHYEYQARHQYGDVDALFMVAALWYLLDQEHTAHYAIDVAVTLGDGDISTVNLKSMIESAYP
jgi:tetratricopeptide (TPR) repeat protein